MKHELLPCMIDWGRFVKVHEVLHSVYWCTIVAEPKVKVQTIPEWSGTDRAKFLDEIWNCHLRECSGQSWGVSCGRKNRTLCIDSQNITPPVEYCQNICFYCRSLWWVSMKHWGCFRRADFKTNWTMWTSSGKLLVFGRLFRPLSRVKLIRYAQNIGLETQNWGWISVLFCHSNDYCFIILHFHYWFIILP